MTEFRGARTFDALPPCTRTILIVNVVAFLLQMVAPQFIIEVLALTPILIIKKFWVWQMFTYAFVHGSGWHLFFNMFALWMFGPIIEGRWGTRTFLTYYFTCVLGAAFAQLLIAPTALVAGASGAIYGLLLAFGLMFPDAVIFLFFIFPLRAIQAVLFIALLTFVSAVSSGGSRIAHFAHLGGMLAGFLYLKLPLWWSTLRSRSTAWRFQRLLNKPRRRTNPEDDLTNEVDRILEKISSQGIESLTPGEHEVMQRYAAKRKR